MDSKGRITEGSARELGKLVKWYRGLPRNKAGKAVAPQVIDDHGPWLGVAQADILARQSGPVNFWTGPKGQETDSGVTVQVYCRFSNLSTEGGINNGEQIYFYAVDGGYEALRQDSYVTVGPNPQTPCITNRQTQNVLACGQCSPIAVPLTTCSQKTKVSSSYVLTDWGGSLNLTDCCASFAGSKTALNYVSGCTWETATFACGSATATKWQLVIGDTYTTLTWLIDDNHSVLYQARTDEFSSVCGGSLKLISPKTPQTCSMPCYVCVLPIIVSNYCNSCTTPPPQVWTVSFNNYSPVAGTYDVPAITTLQVNTSCFWQLDNVNVVSNDFLSDITITSGGEGQITVFVHHHQSGSGQTGDLFDDPPNSFGHGPFTCVGGENGIPWANGWSSIWHTMYPQSTVNLSPG
jgi:hypothetical protein